MIRDGIWRRVWDDAVSFQPSYLSSPDEEWEWDYAVMRYPFVEGFHLVHMYEDPSNPDDPYMEVILSTHKTLHEAMDICRVLLANGGSRKL